MIDRKMIIENWIAHDDLFDTGHENLTAGEHDVQVEFTEIRRESPNCNLNGCRPDRLQSNIPGQPKRPKPLITI